MSDTTRQIDARFPPKLTAALFSKNRYVIIFGGRGGAKSWSIARALLIQGFIEPLRILCVREFMSSVSDSVHKLLSDQIYELGLDDHYTIEKAGIYGKNGTEFRFAGIRNNVSAIKSFEGIDIAWVEEAANVTKSSWDTLIPTIRKAGSRIIVSFNPELETDETYQRFVVNPPPSAIVIKINYDENPWFPKVLKDEAEYMKISDPDGYQNIYLGYPKIFLDDAIYARELRLAQEEDRITVVPYEPLVDVSTFWDLGWRDETAVICAQVVQGEFRIIDFIHDSGQTAHDMVRRLQAKPYIYGTDYLPHDASAKQIGSGRSYQEMLRTMGRRVQIVPRLSINDGINAARVMFDRTWIDQVKCADLIQSLRRYCYDISGLKPVPVHNDSSHAADAFRYMAISLRAPKARLPTIDRPIVQREAGWML